MFTNNHSISDVGVWQIVYLEEDKIDGYVPEVAEDNVRIRNIRLSRKVKMLAHKYLPEGYDMSIYLDADMLIKDDLSILSELLNDNVLMAAFRHSNCTSVRAEIEDLTRRGVVKPAVVENQWQEYLYGCLRDQVSLMPCIYRCGFMPHLKFIEGNVRRNEWVEMKNPPHRV